MSQDYTVAITECAKALLGLIMGVERDGFEVPAHGDNTATGLALRQFDEQHPEIQACWEAFEEEIKVKSLVFDVDPIDFMEDTKRIALQRVYQLKR